MFFLWTNIHIDGKNSPEIQSSNTELSVIRHTLLISHPCRLKPYCASSLSSALGWAGLAGATCLYTAYPQGTTGINNVSSQTLILPPPAC